MFILKKIRLKDLFIIFIIACLFSLFGVFTHLFEKDFNKEFHYPYDGDIEPFIYNLKNSLKPDVAPINTKYNFKFKHNALSKCKDVTNLRLIYIIKSAPGNFNQRLAIRQTWGYEHRFSDVEIRAVFLLGESTEHQQMIFEENERFKDIVQSNFTDSYYNNTYKTMSGFKWVVDYCSNAKFYMFVDDDFYVSTKNVLRYIRFPTNYPKYIKEPLSHVNAILNQRRPLQINWELEESTRLYTGYVFQSSPHRHYTSKWYISLKEYPYHLWPPYVTAGAYILSKEAIVDMYYASFYTKHFKFDDIYVGLLAFKTKIEPFHSEEFYFYKKPHYKMNYNFTIASHGYGDPLELLQVWNEQKSLGNA